MNLVDTGIVLSLIVGLVYGAHRGVLRQILLLSAFYASLVVAARYYGEAAGFVTEHVTAADHTVASAYALAAITTAGTLGLAWLSHGVYRSTRLSRAVAFDRLAGAGLGMAWSWAVVAFAVTVLVYGASFSWGAREALRVDLAAQLDGSRLIGLVRWTLPILRETIAPWLPGGLPVPFAWR
jgi:uncharacterized membrane protein required for colicin V production